MREGSHTIRLVGWLVGWRVHDTAEIGIGHHCSHRRTYRQQISQSLTQWRDVYCMISMPCAPPFSLVELIIWWRRTVLYIISTSFLSLSSWILKSMLIWNNHSTLSKNSQSTKFLLSNHLLPCTTRNFGIMCSGKLAQHSGNSGHVYGYEKHTPPLAPAEATGPHWVITGAVMINKIRSRSVN